MRQESFTSPSCTSGHRVIGYLKGGLTKLSVLTLIQISALVNHSEKTVNKNPSQTDLFWVGYGEVYFNRGRGNVLQNHIPGVGSPYPPAVGTPFPTLFVSNSQRRKEQKGRMVSKI